MAGKTAILSIRILGDAKEAQQALDETATSAGKFQSGVQKAAVPAAAALAGLAAAGVSAAKAAAEDQQAADLLAVALRNSAGASEASIAKTEAWISKTSKAAAVADDELRPALATLVRATGDVGESQDAMAVALDVSAATGKDVESVSSALAKAYAGQTTSLGKLVPGMDKAVLASGDMDAIMAELARTTGGSAAAAANSAAGQWKGFQIQLGEAQEAIGAALLPAMSGLGSALQTVAGWVQQNTTLFLVIGGVLAGVATAILLVNAAFKIYAVTTQAITALTKAWAVAQRILNSAFLANPVFLIIAAIVALVVAIVILWQKNEAFRNFVIGMWEAILSAVTAAWDWIVDAGRSALDWLTGAWDSFKSAVQAVWDWIVNAIKSAWSIIVALGTAYINVYVTLWNLLKAGVQAVWDWIVNAIKSALAFVVGIIQFYISIYVAVFEGIKSAVGAVWDWLKSAATTALDAILKPINAVRSAFDKVVDAIRSVIDWLGRIKIPDVLKNIGSAIGGLFSASPAAARSTGTAAFAVAGAPNLRASTLASTAPAAARRGSVGVVVNVNGALDPVAVARQIRTILRDDERRRGGVVLTAARA